MTDAGVLVVGYGNSLRGDDGIGWHAARLLASDPRLAGARVLACHQLVPELAVDVTRAALEGRVPAAPAGDSGGVSGRRDPPRRTDPATWSHHLDPESLAGLAEALYGVVPPIVLVSVVAESFTGADRLSGALERALPKVVEVVADVVSGQHQA